VSIEREQIIEQGHTERPIIAIEGPIGAGKSTLCRWMRRYHSASVADEAQSSLLPAYFRDPRRFAFTVQVDSLTQRHKVLKASWSLSELVTIWLDRSIFGDLAFARANHAVGYMDAQEFSLYRELYDTMLDSTEPPHAVLWLDVPLEVCAARVEQRGTAGEVVPTEYAEALISAYTDILKDAESRGVYVHRVDWSRDLSAKGLYHARADSMLTGFRRTLEGKMA
jgi:deoxyadenosine/deoxycytidine kinase